MTINKIRTEIDIIDKQIQSLLAKRFDLILSLKPLKTEILDPKREDFILSQIDSSWIKKVYVALLEISKDFLKNSK